MDVKQNKKTVKKIRVFLVFFYVFCIHVFSQSSEPFEVKVSYSDNSKAIMVAFDSVAMHNELEIRLQGSSMAILGSFSTAGSQQLFTPLVPFTPQKRYHVYHNGNVKGTFIISSLEGSAPWLLNSYPTIATVPENLLKVYFQFSEPMQQVGNTLDFIKVVDRTANKEVDLFLELQNELWNHDSTILTLWLDPGRIKTGLIPNKEKGLPLMAGHVYEISIDSSWRSALGIGLEQSYKKVFTVIGRDNVKPSLSAWVLSKPRKNFKDKLTIQFNEPLDAILIQKTIHLYLNDQRVPGKILVLKDEKTIQFDPVKVWKEGEYILKVDAVLEDLAGNNLNHPFDRDLTKDVEATFTIHKTRSFIVE